MEKYDLVVIGSGPAGEKAAVKAAYFKRKVALIERTAHPGGAAVHEAIPSKVLKEIALHLSGKIENELYGLEATYRPPSLSLFVPRARALSKMESEGVRQNLHDHGVTLYQGEGSFVSPHEIRIGGKKPQTIWGENVLIATGSSASYKFKSGDVDGKRVHNVETILHIDRYPKSLCVIGTGISGCEYGSTFSFMGTKVYFVNRTRVVLPTFDQSIVHFFLEEMEKCGIDVLFDCEIATMDIPDNDTDLIHIVFKDGQTLDVDMVLYTYGRLGNLKMLQLENAGVIYDENLGISTNKHYQSNVPHIYAIGDVNGQIRLANIAMDQGRVAVASMFNLEDITGISDSIPYGMYSIPEVAMVGMTEEMMKKRGLDYEVGVAYYGDTARGKFLGTEGVIKVVFTKHDQVIQGVHIVGALATELIHYGVSIVREKKTLLFLINEPFNYPTLHEAYKYAAYDGLGALSGYKLKKHHTKHEL
jgi:NAD(P) transhydrogenase